MSAMQDVIEIGSSVAQALSNGDPVVALESTLITHGLPHPHNLETALGSEAAVKAAGATPATIGILNGRLVIGLSEAQIEAFATERNAEKVSRRDLARVLAEGRLGATTVSATIFAAERAGIPLLATGGIGGVHRGGENSLDVSADLVELGRTQVAVVASGAKSILDLPLTLEVLETHGVPVIGYGCDQLPAFYARSSGLALEARVDGPEAAATLLKAHFALAPGNGLLLANPPPEAVAIPFSDLEIWTAEAERRAEAAKVTGKAVTPFLLQQIFELSEGRTLETNVALIEANAAAAAEIARELAAND